jgi:hypothetical protein
MTRRTALLLAVTIPATKTGFGQEQRVSPHETVDVSLNGKKISITYGRPYLKGRHLGDPMAPFGRVWRLGADEATKLTISAPMKFEKGPELPAGSYSLYAILQPDKWTIIVNKVADQWGTNYDQGQDFARFDLPVKRLTTPVEELTISLEKQNSNTARLTFAWDKESVSTTMTVR